MQNSKDFAFFFVGDRGIVDCLKLGIVAKSKSFPKFSELV
jgi:hypothetical protein